MIPRHLLPPALLVAVALTAACGRTDAPPAPAAAPTSAAPATSGRTLELSADDTMKFSATQFTAAPGETLRLTLTNKGKIPKQAMAHNWVLLKPMSDVEVNAFGMKASTTPPDYLPADRSSVLVHTRMLGPGESDTIAFTAPATPGMYPFLCTFPGHFALMKGTLIVK